MKLVTYSSPPRAEAGGVLLDDHHLLDLQTLLTWAPRAGGSTPPTTLTAPTSLLTLIQAGDDAMRATQEALTLARAAGAAELRQTPHLLHSLHTVTLHTPITQPPTLRDFYAFEQHVKAARARRNAVMIPEWYQFPVFYFSNTAALFGADEPIPYPTASHELDFELELAAVIGRPGANIAADDAPAYIAGYMVMNDWSARDLQRQEMTLNLGPAKGKDFATSLGPWLVTPDELTARRIGSGKDERYDLAMTGRINGDQLTSDNAKTLYFTFPQMIERASQHVRLRPGDIIGSGTCGTGCILELGVERHRWLQPGDIVEMEIELLGVLRNTIVAAS